MHGLAVILALALLDDHTQHGKMDLFEDPSMQFGAVYQANELCELGYTMSDFAEYEKDLKAYVQEKILLGAYIINSQWKGWSSAERARFCALIKGIELRSKPR